VPTITNLTSGAGSAATSFATASVAPTSNRLILVAVHAYISTGSVQPATPTVTGNGITYALVQAQDVDTSGVDRATEWVFRGLAASPTSGAVTISFGAVTMTRCAWSVDQSDSDIDLSSTNGAGAIAQKVGATSAGATSLSVSYSPAMRSDSAGYSAWGHQVQEAKTPRTSWTELSDVTSVTLANMETQFFSGTDTAASASWTTSSRAGGIAIEIKKAAPFVWVGGYGLQGGTTALTMVPPSGTSVGDLEILWVANKNSSVDPTDPSGGSSGTWVRRGSFEVGTGADGVGTGKIRLTVWSRILIAANSNTSITITAANRSLGGGQVYHLTGAGTWATPTVEFGSDTDSSTTTFAAVMASDLGALVDDYTLSIGAFTANTTLNGRTLTVPNWSHSRLDGIDSGGGATGNQIFVWTDQRVGMIGSQSGAATTGATSGVGTTGGAVNIRIGLSSGVTGTIAATQAGDAAAASGQLGYAGTIASAQANQTASASGTVINPVTGTVAAAQASDTAAATGKLGYTGTVAASQANQTGALTGQLGYTGSITASQTSQTAAVVGQLGYSGTAVPTQANQTAAIVGTYASPGAFTGTIAATQANQAASASGKLGYSGTVTATQAGNTAALTGAVISPITGTITTAQANNAAAITGKLGYAGSIAVSQGSNTAAIQGTVFIPIVGVIAATQGNQTASITGSTLGATVIRPATGTTSRPGSGRTVRPFTGVTPRP